MSDDQRSSPFDTADYLKTPDDIAGFLEAIIEDCDEQIFDSALQDAVRAAKRITSAQMAGFSDKPDEPSLNRLVSLLHVLGFELAFRPRRAA
jgi:DNA-binding phage protein